MASILDRYGIKEVADVTLYEIGEGGVKGAPVLYLDTLKVSTIEQTADSTSARGGKGNAELIIWDFGKEITLNLEDALFSAKSMAIMFGSVDKKGQATLGTSETIYKTVRHGALPTTVTSATYYKEDGTPGTSESYAYATYAVTASNVSVITISAETFPGTYYVTGDTFARSEDTGKDEFFQFIIPKAKMLSDVTLTLEAEGDPSTFSMQMKVLRPKDGVMMKLVQYNMTE